ncbi:temptin [Biomphalaria pfeifferi]|uniref:Temptin n=1 Tax=Biomphalaria pfeifferi TaxID=112525 RepID=A0AAD8AQU5_BIOPF|nr:temptin [Biomphalaria pfeifferi]
MKFVCLVVLLLACVYGHPWYANLIPNGDNLPNPCKPGERWQGVGHNNPSGGLVRNNFGLDFKAANFTWTKELCEKDSDGDGRSNGEELGDPNCTWKQGKEPYRTTDITHPGINPKDPTFDCDKVKP